MPGKKKSRRFRQVDNPEKEFLKIKEKPLEDDLSSWQEFLSSAPHEIKGISVQKPKTAKEIKPIRKNTKTNLIVNDLTGVDGSKAKKFKRGKIKIDAVLDLHGLNLKQAEELINEQIRNSFEDGKRTIKIITGKGRNSEGLIKKYTPEILNNSKNRNKIIAINEAPYNDGGSGALYVLLKKNKD